MIFHLTQKLAKNVKLHLLQALPEVDNPFLDWTANLFSVEHTQYIIITNTLSLYNILMYGRGITNENEFTKNALNSMREYMTNDGCEFIYRRLIEPYTSQISFSKVTNKNVLGSMNDLIYGAKFFISERHLSLFETSLIINDTPMKYIGYRNPSEAFREIKTLENIE